MRRFAKLAPKLEKISWRATREVEWTWKVERRGGKVFLEEDAEISLGYGPSLWQPTFPGGGGVLMRAPAFHSH